MPSVFGKLNLKAQREILVMNAPASFEVEIAALKNVSVLRDPEKSKDRAIRAGICNHTG